MTTINKNSISTAPPSHAATNVAGSTKGNKSYRKFFDVTAHALSLAFSGSRPFTLSLMRRYRQFPFSRSAPLLACRSKDLLI